jgi:hypothetical protein
LRYILQSIEFTFISFLLYWEMIRIILTSTGLSQWCYKSGLSSTWLTELFFLFFFYYVIYCIVYIYLIRYNKKKESNMLSILKSYFPIFSDQFMLLFFIMIIWKKVEYSSLSQNSIRNYTIIMLLVRNLYISIYYY